MLDDSTCGAGAPGSGWFTGEIHVFPVRVYYEDTDAAGIVYYANYLRFIERGRTEMMRVLGVEHSWLRREQGVAFAVRRCAIDYRAPARLDDVLEVRTRITDIGGATLGVEQIVRRDGQDLALAELRLACINQEGRPVRLPGPVRDAVSSIFLRQPFPKGRD